MVSALDMRAHPSPFLHFLLLVSPVSALIFTRPWLRLPAPDRLTHRCCFAPALFYRPAGPKAAAEWCGPHTHMIQHSPDSSTVRKNPHILHLIIETQSFRRGQLIQVYRRINRTGKRNQDLLFSLSNSLKMQQEHNTRDAVFSSAYDAVGYKRAYTK